MVRRSLLLVLCAVLLAACSGTPEPERLKANGFVITRSGEYFKDGKWHDLAPVYTHNDAFCTCLPDGRVLLAGGTDGSFFEASATALVFHTQGAPHASSAYRWGLLAGVLAALALVYLGALLARRSRKKSPEPELQPEPAPTPDLLSRITALMEKRQFFRRKDLRIGDIASELGTNSTYISACLNSQLGVSFPTLVARYRVAYAQELMRREPDRRILDIADDAGFANEATFFRAFKQITGQTPAEWKATSA